MSRKLICVLTAVVSVSCVAVGSALVWPNIAGSTDSRAFAVTAEFANGDVATDDSAKAGLTNDGPADDGSVSEGSVNEGSAIADVAHADFDRAFASVAALPRRQYVPAFLTMIDFERLFTGENALPRRDYVPVVLTAVEFERVFGSVSRTRRDNTPPNREKLRNAGWKRVLGSG